MLTDWLGSLIIWLMMMMNDSSSTVKCSSSEPRSKVYSFTELVAVSSLHMPMNKASRKLLISLKAADKFMVVLRLVFTNKILIELFAIHWSVTNCSFWLCFSHRI